MATRRTGRTRPSTTTQKSSEKQTEKPQSDSQASEKESDETSTQAETSTSSSSSDDENDALFEEADQKAAEGAQSDDESDDDSEDPEDSEDGAEDQDGADSIVEEAKDAGEVTTFEVDLPNLRTYTFKGVVTGNTIVVTEDATREFTLPGSTKKGKVLAHHKGQTLPLASYEPFIKKGK